LANSGSLIVFKPNDNEERSYIYLGNSFLASGYGFATESKLKIAERIVDTYDDTINGLRNIDADLRNTIVNNYNTLLNKLKEYVKIGSSHEIDDQENWGGDISNTYVILEGNKVPLFNIIQHGREADYQDIEIKKITKSVITENTTYTIDDASSILNLPIGTIIKKVQIKIEYDPHDSGGIGKLLVKYSPTDNQPKSIYVYYDGDVLPVPGQNNLYEKTFVLDLNQNQYTVKNIDFDVISNIYAVILKSPEYKYYPELESLFGIHIHSTAYSILEHETSSLASLSIHPLSYIKYYDYAIATPNVNLDNLKVSPNLLNDKEKLISDAININEKTRRILVSVPSIFKVTNISFIPNETLNTYTGNEEYNWSGSFSIVSNLNISYQQINNPLCVTSNIYDIIISNNENDLPNGLLKISMINDTEDGKVRINYNKTTQYNNSRNKRLVNESFDSIHWVNTNIGIENRLKEIYRNGLDVSK